MIEKVLVHPYIMQDIEDMLKESIELYSNYYTFSDGNSNDRDNDHRRILIVKQLSDIQQDIQQTRSISSTDITFIKVCLNSANNIDYTQRFINFLFYYKLGKSKVINWATFFIVPLLISIFFIPEKMGRSAIILLMVVFLTLLGVLIASVILDIIVPKKNRVNSMYNKLEKLLTT